MPPNLQRVGNWITGTDQFSGVKYAVLLFENIGGADITGLNFSDVRFYFDVNNPNLYVNPTSLSMEPALPQGSLFNTPPGYRVNIRFNFPTTINGLVRTGTISVRGTSNEGSFNAGSLFLVFP